MAKQNTSWNFNLEEGLLDNARLHRLIANPSYPLSFKQETENNFKAIFTDDNTSCHTSDGAASSYPWRGRSDSLLQK